MELFKKRFLKGNRDDFLMVVCGDTERRLAKICKTSARVNFDVSMTLASKGLQQSIFLAYFFAGQGHPQPPCELGQSVYDQTSGKRKIEFRTNSPY